jgi:hypothetical protein
MSTLSGDSFYIERSLGETDDLRGLCVSPKWSVDIKCVKTTVIGMIFLQVQ